MNDAERRETGTRIRREVLGDEHLTRAQSQVTPLTEEFQDLITRYAWGEIWSRPGLDLRSRRVLVLGTLIALGRWEEFHMHVRAALGEGSFAIDDIKEIILQQAIYCGVPAAHHAFAVIADLAEAGHR